MLKSIVVPLAFLCFIGSVWSDDPKCEKVGPICNAEKTKIMFCPSKGADPKEVESCGEGEICIENKDKVVCEKPAEKELRFECSGPGEFPDPKDCSKTYICKSKEGKPSEVCSCPPHHFVYPTEGLFCVPGSCPRKDITCEEGKQGHFELLAGGKTSFYYYCKSADVVTVYGGVETLVNRSSNPAMLRGMVNGKECVPLDNNDDPSQQYKCKEYGEQFPTECDCDFFYCDKALKVKRITCYKGLHYNVKRRTCVTGKCDESKCIYRDKYM
ncbi:UNVERIFIED_CONTAM: hypothetical protein PYX00_010287 [Menopon gallinae]|uniref:Uncharacterized protein n=1 Tax=Menopon gallinae TaxID=328185 RepID=A0AAW2HEN8_9NEOP